MDQMNNRNNNLNFIRLIAAFMVLAGHMGIIIGNDAPIFLFQQLHELGVATFFVIGGYLITKSWNHDHHVGRYAVKRFFRIYPEYLVCILLTVFVLGPVVKDVPWGVYAEGIKAYLWNLRFFIVFYLPGVFDHNPYPNAVNGSLWTQPVELLMYVITPLVLTLLHFIRNKKISKSILLFLTIGTAIVNFNCILSAERPMLAIYGTDWVSALPLITYWLIGMTMAELGVEKSLNLQIASAAIVAAYCFQPSGIAEQLIIYILWPYFVMSFGLDQHQKPLFSKVGSKLEISYGIYLYGFPVQQAIVSLFIMNNIALNYNICLLLSAAVTVLIAIASNLFVQKPADKLQRVVIRQMR